MTEQSHLFVKMEPDTIVINADTEDDRLTCVGYTDSLLHTILFYFLTVVTCGGWLLLVLWQPELDCYVRRKRCSVADANTLLIMNFVKQKSVVHIKTEHFDDGSLGLSAYHRDSSSEEDDSSDTARLTAKFNKRRDKDGFSYFDHQHVRYIWDQGLKTFVQLTDLSVNTKCSMLHEQFHGLSALEQAQKRMVYSKNKIEVEVKSYWRLFIEEVMNPFYVFQIFSIILWVVDDYYYYAGAIFLISAISIAISLYEIKKQAQALHDMVAAHDSNITVCRGKGVYEEISNDLLVPGDVIVIPSNGCLLMCDAVLQAGTCIVNESMLTGESVPVTKTPLTQQEDNEIYSTDVHKRHTLFSGTHVVQTRYYGNNKVTAVVVRTGFRTAKGDLVRSILFPKPLDFQFYKDAMKFILFLGLIAMIGMTYTVVVFIRDGVAAYHIVLRVLDVITIIVPAALPAAMTVGVAFAQSRLKKANIFCISPPRINFCGRLDVFCFDKTGTLTEDGLDLLGVVPVYSAKFSHLEIEPSQMQYGPTLVCMATCHSLTLIGGNLSGDPLDLIMFESTKWLLEEPGRDTSKFDTMMPTVVKPITRDTFLERNTESTALPNEVGIIRQFTFSSNTQRMSVIARTLGKDNFDLYCKGAPEKIASLCNPETVPPDFNEMLSRYTVQGHRVLALAWRPLDPKLTWHQAQRIPRDKVENELTFLGLLVMQNKLKPQSKPVIRTLKKANIRTVMITGDMIETAVSVARNCGMVPFQDRIVIVDAHPPTRENSAYIEYRHAQTPTEGLSEVSEEEDHDIYYSKGEVYIRLGNTHLSTHLAINGRSLSVITEHFPELLPKICVAGTVFARMSPEQKCQLIQSLQDLGYHVGMCGDGANDCEALKAAHAGISLSDAEASIAAPFTSKIPHIECVVTVMREGRAALTTSFACFKYMALYSFIQFVSVMILYWYDANLSDVQFLYIDLVITTTIAILMGYTKAERTLSARRPPGSLVKLSNLLSVTGQVILVTIVQIAALGYLVLQPWYSPPSKNKNADDQLNWETTVVFLVSSYQYMAVAFCFSRGPPFRRPIYHNIPYTLALIILVGFSTFLIAFPIQPLYSFIKLMRIEEHPVQFRMLLLVFPVGHFIFCTVLEYILTETKCVKKTCGRLRKKTTKCKYKVITGDILLSDWPTVGQKVHARHRISDVTKVHVDLGRDDLTRSLTESANAIN